MPLLAILLGLLLASLIEIWVLIEIGGVIGAGWTVGLVVFTAIAGVALVRSQGLATIGRIQAQIARGEIPATEIFEGVGLLLAGVFLLTPGFVTDALGFALLVPPLRRLLVNGFIQPRLLRMVQPVVQRPATNHGGGRTLEGESQRIKD